MKNSFAAFVMTFRRPEVLEGTIQKIFDQTIPPKKILIIDNDPLQSGKSVIQKLSNYPIEYFAIGYNSGPAGAAKKGLEMLSNQGYEWIAWIDDDDPPIFIDTFEILLKIGSANSLCGCIGTVGQRFNQKNGLITRVADAELEGDGIILVDNIAGGMCKIVNSLVVRKKNILPDDKLFYGFEELDFDLRLQKAGYLLLADKFLYRKHRQFFNRSGINVKRGHKKEESRLWREYYSTRNTLIIFTKLKLYRALVFSLLRYLFKLIAGFRFGLKYGVMNMSYISKGIFHFLIKKSGRINHT